MMQKEEKVVFALLIMAALSLTIGYFGFSKEKAAYSKDTMIGESVYAEGTILSKQMTAKGDNLLLTISNLNIKVFIQKENGAKEIYALVKNGDKVRIEGKVQEYRNTRELVVDSAKDVDILSHSPV